MLPWFRLTENASAERIQARCEISAGGAAWTRPHRGAGFGPLGLTVAEGAELEVAGIPPQLFYGIARGAFRFYGDDPRSIEQSGRRHRWADEVYRAGYTVPSLRQAAGTDALIRSGSRGRPARPA